MNWEWCRPVWRIARRVDWSFVLVRRASLDVLQGEE